MLGQQVTPAVGWAVLLLLASLAQADDTRQFLSWAARLPDRPEVELAEDYRFANEVFQPLAELVREERVEVERIGTSGAGRPLWAFHIAGQGEIERKVLVFGGIHALEWISVEVATDLALETARIPPEGVRLTVIPILNPDGRSRVEQDLREGKRRYRRGNQANVDLNRDFEVHRDARAPWKAVLPAYYSTSPAPLSQPESRALDALAAREQFDRAASLHAFGGFFYHPWSGRWERPEDFREYHRLGRLMEDAQGAHAYKTRQLSRWGFFFRAQGTELDHLYGRYGTLTYLVELTRSGIHPLKPSTWNQYFRWYNPPKSRKHRVQGVQAMRVLLRQD